MTDIIINLIKDNIMRILIICTLIYILFFHVLDRKL